MILCEASTYTILQASCLIPAHRHSKFGSLDRGDVLLQLRRSSVNIVVSASGPLQQAP